MVAGSVIPRASCSAANVLVGDAPAPRPSTNRPPEMFCTVAAALASTPGCLLPTLATSGPMLIVEVIAANAPSKVKHSGIEGAFITSPDK